MAIQYLAVLRNALKMNTETQTLHVRSATKEHKENLVVINALQLTVNYLVSLVKMIFIKINLV